MDRFVLISMFNGKDIYELVEEIERAVIAVKKASLLLKKHWIVILNDHRLKVYEPFMCAVFPHVQSCHYFPVCKKSLLEDEDVGTVVALVEERAFIVSDHLKLSSSSNLFCYSFKTSNMQETPNNNLLLVGTVGRVRELLNPKKETRAREEDCWTSVNVLYTNATEPKKMLQNTFENVFHPDPYVKARSELITNGFAIIRGVVPSSNLSKCLKCIQSKTVSFAESLKCSSYLSIVNRWTVRNDPERPSPLPYSAIENVVNYVQEYLRCLLPSQEVSCKRATVLYKGPEKRNVIPWHQDGPYSQDEYDLSVWIPLTSTKDDGYGELQYDEGSHTGARRDAVDFWNPSFEDEYVPKKIVPVQVPLGSISMHFGSTMHRSTEYDRRDGCRYAIAVRFKFINRPDRTWAKSGKECLENATPYGMKNSSKVLSEKLLELMPLLNFDKTSLVASDPDLLRLTTCYLEYLNGDDHSNLKSSLSRLRTLIISRKDHLGEDNSGLVYKEVWQTLSSLQKSLTSRQNENN